MNLDDLFKDIKTKKEPMCLIKDHTELQFLAKRMDDVTESFKNKALKLQAELEVEGKKVWKDINSFVIKNNLGDTKNNMNLDTQNGILFRYVED